MPSRLRRGPLPSASVRVRLTLWYTLLLVGTVVVLGAALYFLLVRTLAAQADQDVAATTLAVARAIGTDVDDRTGQVDLRLPELSVVGDADTFVQVVDLRMGHVLARTANLGARSLPPPAPPFPTNTQSGGSYQTDEGEGLLNLARIDTGQRLALQQTLRQLLLILVDNAAKYTPSGGRITLAVCRTHGEAPMSVSDTGVGIPRQELGRIFERFYRADAVRGTDGSGLGLAIARSIVQQHDGRIEASSEPGRGTTFTVILRLVGSAARPLVIVLPAS